MDTITSETAMMRSEIIALNKAKTDTDKRMTKIENDSSSCTIMVSGHTSNIANIRAEMKLIKGIITKQAQQIQLLSGYNIESEQKVKRNNVILRV